MGKPPIHNPNQISVPPPRQPPLIDDRRKMSTDINQEKPANYIISNTDDVDDVIVRPISQTSISSLSRNDPKPIAATNGDAAKQQQLPPQSASIKLKSATPDEMNRSQIPTSGYKSIPRPDSTTYTYNDKPRVEPQTVRSPVPLVPPPASKIAQPTSARKISPDDAGNKVNNGTIGTISSATKSTVSQTNKLALHFQLLSIFIVL